MKRDDIYDVYEKRDDIYDVYEERDDKRNEVGRLLATITFAKQRATRFQSTEDDLKRLEKINKAVEKITELTKDVSAEELQEILGGEFTKVYLYGKPYDAGKAEIPAYFLLDVAAGVIDKQCSQVSDISSQTRETLAKIKELRDKAVELDYNPLFSPDKHVPKDFIETISKMGNDYSLDVKTAEGVQYLELRLVILKKNDANSEMPLYTEDAAVIATKREEKIQKRLETLNKITKKYFKDGVIPKWEEFEWDKFRESLLDPSLDSRIVDLLMNISHKKSRFSGTIDKHMVESSYFYRDVEAVSYVEDMIEKERLEEQRKVAIKKARGRYNAKSPLWRLFHRKQNIDNMELSTMTTEQISSLYTNNGSSRKK